MSENVAFLEEKRRKLTPMLSPEMIKLSSKASEIVNKFYHMSIPKPKL